MFGRRRKQILQRWRARRGEEADRAVDPDDTAALRVRTRRRAPTPSLRPSLRALRRSPSRLLAVGATLVLALLVGHLSLSARYYVYGAEVRGQSRLAAETVYAASELDGMSAFFVNPAAVARRVERLEDVQRANVEVRLPAAVRITIEETAPILLWTTGGQTVAIDENGRPVAPPAGASLVAVSDEVGLLDAPGDRLAPELLAAAQALGPHFGPLTYRDDVGFVAESDRGWEVRLGQRATLAERQAVLLRALERELDDQRHLVRFVDLRFPSRPYYRLKPEWETP